MKDVHNRETERRIGGITMTNKDKRQTKGAREMQNLRYVWMRRKHINVFANGMSGQEDRNQPPAKCLVNCWRWTVSIFKFIYRLIRSLQMVDYIISRREAIQGIAKWGWELLRDLPTNLPC